MCVKENYKSEVLLICVFIALLWGAGNTSNTKSCGKLQRSTLKGGEGGGRWEMIKF